MGEQIVLLAMTCAFVFALVDNNIAAAICFFALIYDMKHQK